MTIRKICILGGSGFLGRYLIEHLGRAGFDLRVLSRHPQRHRDLTTHPRVELRGCNVHDTGKLEQELRDVNAIINLVGILNDTGSPENRFEDCHVALPSKLAELAKRHSIGRMIHLSALNANSGLPQGEYLRSKGRGEDIAHQAGNAGIAVTSFRPSVIFGPGDSFFNRFQSLLRLAPGVFPLACASTRFSPVYVADVAEAITRSVNNRESFGKKYELCGPQVYTLKQLVEYTARLSGLRRRVIGLPDSLSRLQARILQHAPGKPFTMDNYYSLQHDSICNEPNEWPFGITPTAIEAVTPAYLANQNVRARYDRYRKLARRL